jgi:Xaa-Pro aminopeptidase
LIVGLGPAPVPDPAPLALPPSPLAARRADIDAKQERVAALLVEAGADGLLLLDPANVAWLAGAPLGQGLPDGNERPALWVTTTQRWLVAGSTDSQRLFDVHLDGLGFQLKEWAWHWGRDRLLNDLRQNRRVACDRVLPDSVPVGPALRRLRCALTPAEQARLGELGALVAHAVEATGRNLAAGQSELEAAGQLSHRLWHRGARPVALTAAADGRARRHPRPGVTDATIQRSCLLAATASRFGLHATAARTICFGPPDPVFRQEFDAACRIAAALIAAGTAGTTAATVIEAGQRAAHLVGQDEEWRIGPPGYLTGWQPIERLITPSVPLTFEAGWAIVWQVGVGSALVGDTYLTAPPECVTPAERWPVKRIHLQGRMIDVPDLGQF